MGQRPKEARQRVLISTQYERKIDHFEGRLANIENMIRELTLSLTNREPSSSASGADPFAITPAQTARATPASMSSEGAGVDDGDDRNDDGDAPVAFEGDSSMTAQTAFASEFLQEAVGRSPFGELNPDMETALQSLQQIVGMQNRQKADDARFENARPLPKGGFRELPMPPLAFVVSLIREMKGEYHHETEPRSFSLIWINAAAPAVFGDLVRLVYFPTEDYNIATFAAVNTGLYFLMTEKLWDAQGPKRDEISRHLQTVRQNIETALVNLPLLLPPRRESVMALVLGSTYAVEWSKYTLAWRFNTAAIALCQMMGLHRQPTSPEQAADPAVQADQAAFWFCYAYDKTFSLRFGRNSMVQDDDITIARTLGPSIIVNPLWRPLFDHWVMHAEFAGKVYERLYTPVALTRPPEQRAEIARTLIAKLEELKQKMTRDRESMGIRGPTRPSEIDTEPNPFSIQMSVYTDDVLLFSATCLVYRALPNNTGSPGTLYPGCVEAARMAFERHFECIRLAGDNIIKSGYINWTILYVPFVPVIVLFCNVIETSDLEDLQRLINFTDSLQPVCEVSKATEKFYRVCRVLCNVARVYIETKVKQSEDATIVGNDIDMYLSQLGFIPQQLVHGHSANPGAEFDGGLSDFNQASQLGNWFSGNRHIMNLVEGDLTDFSPGIWTDD
ncbi:hypothetical protein OQA88_4567 [Cercophora sp. LCS_1]